ncbi:MAG TPA: S1/P1 nuclease [Gemmataceae bacterium]|nr:S1/P1 nuclease [Gemmataceae bacterium]
MVQRCLVVAIGMLLALVPSRAFAWNSVGHKTVAMIAYKELSPSVRKKAIDLLRKHPELWADLTKDMPADVRDPDIYVFTKAATFPDMAKSPHDPFHATQGNFKCKKKHYINLPVGSDTDLEALRPPVPGMEGGDVDNVVKALNQCVADLRSSEKSTKDKAIQLCWLMHLVGDIHQPLHCAEWYSEQFPRGDGGGGMLLVRPGRGHGHVSLHSIWDDLLGEDKHATLRTIEINVRIIQGPSHLRRDTFADELRQKEFKGWALDSKDKAWEFAYRKGDIQGTSQHDFAHDHQLPIPELPPRYEEECRAVARSQVALAGYRLADQINALLGGE